MPVDSDTLAFNWSTAVIAAASANVHAVPAPTDGATDDALDAASISLSLVINDETASIAVLTFGPIMSAAAPNASMYVVLVLSGSGRLLNFSMTPPATLAAVASAGSRALPRSAVALSNSACIRAVDAATESYSRAAAPAAPDLAICLFSSDIIASALVAPVAAISALTAVTFSASP